MPVYQFLNLSLIENQHHNYYHHVLQNKSPNLKWFTMVMMKWNKPQRVCAQILRCEWHSGTDFEGTVMLWDSTMERRIDRVDDSIKVRKSGTFVGIDAATEGILEDIRMKNMVKWHQGRDHNNQIVWHQGQWLQGQLNMDLHRNPLNHP